MNRQKRLFNIFPLLLILSLTLSACDNQSAQPSDQLQDPWKQTTNGVQYATLTVESEQTKKDLIIVKIDPKSFSFTIYQNPDQKNAKTIEEIHQNTGAEITVNGGFFTENFEPTGLLIANGKELSTLSHAELVNGIIAITKYGQINFFDTTNFTGDAQLNAKKYEFAIQNGPIILDENGSIQTDTKNKLTASRTAMGIDKDNNIILLLIKQSLFNIDNSITLNELAHIAKENEELKKLNIHSLINLDGGSSTGLMIDNKYYPEMEKVQNVVLIKPRTDET